jgi:cation diffusion facilitator CzcD-associated flavoprotein CzcO
MGAKSMTDGTFRVVVAGAGIAGLFMAEKLKQAGIEFSVYEKADEVGGTWRDNTYPGLFVDVLSRQYEFPFQPNYDWSRTYAPAPEIQSYIEKVADDRGLRKYIRFNTEIAEARFTDNLWHIKTADGETEIADVFICATGFLHAPIFPEIEGRTSFAGPSFHSGAWDHSLAMAGKRWGVIGGGASGIQITEALSYEECEVTQFIRRAQWIHIRENPYTAWWERILLRLPFAYQLRQNFLWKFINKADRWRIEPGAMREAMEEEFKKPLQAIRDPELRAKLTPTYKLGGTRIAKSDQNYYEAVQQPNVHIETGDIARIRPEGVELADGTLVELDVLVYATGFDAHAYMRPIKTFGLNGITIDELWKDSIFSYRGVALPGFPNLFMLYGPFAPVNNVPVPLGLDQEIDYILRLIKMARERHSVVVPTQEATEAFVARLQKALPDTVFYGNKNWYSDKTGTPVLWPFDQEEHKSMLADVAPEDLEFIPRDGV